MEAFPALFILYPLDGTIHYTLSASKLAITDHQICDSIEEMLMIFDIEGLANKVKYVKVITNRSCLDVTDISTWCKDHHISNVKYEWYGIKK